MDPSVAPLLTCSADIVPHTEQLCEPAGGVALSFTLNPTNATSTSGYPPFATSFTGNAAVVRMRVLDYTAGAVMWLIWTL